MPDQLPNVSLYYEKTAQTGTIPVVFLHSALGTHSELERLRALFPERTTYSVDLPGHGQTPLTANTTTMESLVENLFQLFESEQIAAADIVGYSLGGYVAMEFAVRYPERVRSVTSHAMKFYWKQQDIANSTMGLDENVLKERAANFYSALQARHTASGADSALRAVRDIIGGFATRQLSIEEINGSNVPVLLTLGDSDDLIPPDEVQALYQALGTEQASLAIFPNTRHDIRTLPIDLYETAQRTFWNAL